MKAVRFAAAIAASTALSVPAWSFMGTARVLIAVCCVAVIVWETTAGDLWPVRLTAPSPDRPR